jgi:D-aminoacyl-tRNA deacylase
MAQGWPRWINAASIPTLTSVLHWLMFSRVTIGRGVGMRVVVQRVSEASVRIHGDVVGSIGRGVLALVGFHQTDTVAEVSWLADKLAGLRIFGDAEGKMNLDLAAVQGGALVVSQFTLYGDASKGRRPSFIDAAQPEIAIPLYQHFIAALRATGVPVQTGAFGADMQVSLTNDGPVTLILERNAP